ncbi:hypothetical protein DM02DRAFT_613878 [Periconia macrospinosa]|uniref:Uncharacterized protein n=1 Tax=Periconia macrospinosa TaxID=97972 RepID=A0A2V1DTA9_9PLEO|nr:hypothetical protein DM02DRAFT_613878 [Periconia macrospinosa]
MPETRPAPTRHRERTTKTGDEAAQQRKGALTAPSRREDKMGRRADTFRTSPHPASCALHGH